MKMIAVTANISREELERIARQELGLAKLQQPAAPIVAFHRHSDAVTAAIQHVIRATEKFDRDQYSPGEASAATALFEAGKRLRTAFHDEVKAKSIEGKFHV